MIEYSGEISINNTDLAVLQHLASPRPHTADFALALANLSAVPPDEARAAIESQRTALAERLQAVQEKKRLDRQVRGHLLPHVEALFSYSENQMTAELDWLACFLSSGIFETKGE